MTAQSLASKRRSAAGRRLRQPSVLILILSLIIGGLLPAMPVSAAISKPSDWASQYASATYPSGTVNASYTVAAGSNRLLVVAIASTRTDIGTQTVSVSYGGQPLTPAAGDGTSASTWNHSYLYYLNEAGIQAASGTSLNVTITGGASYYTRVYAAVYAGVDQSTPFTSARNYNSATANSTVGPFSPTLTIAANDQAIEIVNLARSVSGTTLRAISSWATGWTTAGVAASYAVSGPTQQMYIRDRNVLTAANDGSQHTADSTNTWDSMTAISIKPLVANTAPTIGVISFSSNNNPPYVSYSTTTWTASTGLTAVISDDHLPNPPNQVTGTWSKVSGPGTVSFTNNPLSGAAPLTHATTATFSAVGDYVLQLGATDSALSATPQQFTVKVRLMPTVSMTGGTIPANTGTTGVPYCETYPMSRYFLVTDHFQVTDVELGVNLDHSSRGQIRGGLTSPGGIYYELIAANTGDSYNNYDILLDADTGGALNDTSDDTTTTPYYDRTVLQANLNHFEVADAFGGWHLTLCTNVLNASTGTFNRADLFLNGSFFTPIPPIHKQGPAIAETYYMPWQEDHLYTAINSIYQYPSGCNSQADWDMNPREPIIGYSSITIGIGDTVITYDHWEDGYEATANFPSQKTTQVWGDADLNNGVAPGDVDDVLVTGQILILDDVMNTTTLGAVVDFDGRDKISASQPIAVSRSLWSDGPKTLMAHADEVYPTSYWGTNYVVPVGETSPDADGNMFEYTGASVMAMVDGTTVTFTRRGGGTQSCTLNQGQTCLWNDTYNTYGTGLTAGSTIVSNSGHPIQVSLLTGDYCANFETRSFPLLPTNLWASSYYNPVGTLTSSGGPGSDDAPTVVYLYNAGGSAITVSYAFATGGTSTISVPANGSAKVTMNNLSGAHFWTTSGSLFYAVATVDSDAASGTGNDRNDAYDWGITLVPEKVLSQWLIVGWAPGDDPTYSGSAPENTAPIWLTGGHPTGAADQTSNYDICIDYNGDCPSGSPCTQDPVTGKYYDRKVTGLAPRAQYKIYKNKVVPPDTGQGTTGDDQTGTQIWVCGPTVTTPGTQLNTDVLITAAWGEDPLTANPARPGMDMGDTIRNLRTWLATKGATLLNDVNGNGLYDEGDTIRYSIVVQNTGASAIPANTINVVDTLDANTTYVASTTKLTDHNGSTTTIPDDAPTLFPLDNAGYTYGQGLPPGKSFTIKFDVTINSGTGGGTVCNDATASDGTTQQPLEVCVPVEEPRPGAIGNYVWLDEDGDGDQDAGEAGIPNVTVQLWNAAHTTLIETTVTDAHGGYLFDNLDAGTYVVDVVYSTLPGTLSQTYDEDDGTAPFNTRDSTTVQLAAGEEHMTADFGYNWTSPADTNNPSSSATGALGDRVWLDLDGNGAQGPTEPGIEGVTVQLFTAGADGIFGTGDDVAGPTDVTDANGNYIFDGLSAGAYVVKVISGVPGTYTQTGDPDHFGTTGTNDGMTTAPVILGPGDVFVNADFGYKPPEDAALYSVGNLVFFDADGDGTYGGSDYGIPGVTVSLIKDLDGDGTWDKSFEVIDGRVDINDDGTLSAADDGVLQGVTIIDGRLDLNHNGAIDGADDGTFYGITVINGELDVNGSGTVTTSDDGSTVGEPVIATDITDASGQYLFDGLPADDYIVWVNDTENVLAEVVQSSEPDGTPPITDGGVPCVACDSFFDVYVNADLVHVDFGYTAPGHSDTEGLIGDTIFLDRNLNGSPDAGEGLEGVMIKLLDSTGEVVASTYTDENGHYSFGGLEAGTYTVQVVAGTLPNGGAGLTNYTDPDNAPGAGNNSSSVTIGAGGINLVQDFGYRPSTAGSIGNLVWNDVNADGNVDGGEAGIAGVTVDLYADRNGNGVLDSGDTLVGTTTTAGDGSYLFSNLPTSAAGVKYLVDVTDTAGKLAGYWQSYGSTGVNDNSQVDPYAVTLTTASPNNLTADFGYYVQPAAVGNFVWADLDADGIQDTGEPGMNGIEVTLTIAYPNGQSTTVTVVTGPDPVSGAPGWYSFGNLLQDEDYNGAGTYGAEPTYTVSINTAQPALSGWGASPTGAGTIYTDSNNPAGTLTQPVEGQTNTLRSNDGAVNASYDFGFIRLADIGNYVWLDENNDGHQDAGEAGIANVKVELRDAAGTVVLATTYTDAAGGYMFHDLLPGSYQVRIPDTNFASGGALEGMAQTTHPVNAGADFGNQTLYYNVTVGFGGENLTADFGYNYADDTEVNDNSGTGAIGDRVWSDTDGDGHQDTDEIGIGNVTVDLYYDSDNDGYADDYYGTTTTDADGNYIFDELPKGIYEVRVTDTHNVLSGYTQTGDPDHFGTTGTPNDGKTTTPVVLGPGDVFVNADFGYRPTGDSGTIGDTVYFDADADGTYEPNGNDGQPSTTADNEYPIAGVTVALIKDTNGDGSWDPDGADNLPGTADDEPIIAQDVTDANGLYQFTGLPITNGAGTDDYLVWVNDTDNVLATMNATADYDGLTNPASGFVSGKNIAAVTDLDIPANTNADTDVDFGYTANGQRPNRGLIGDYVYIDRDGSGNYQPYGADGIPGTGDDENAIEGVIVELYDSTGLILLGRTTTDENGYYYFPNLPAGSYEVKITNPANFLTSGALNGMTYSVDPDIFVVDGISGPVVLAPGAMIDLNQDFGLATPEYAGSIGNLIWNDVNANGVVDAGENGIAGVTVDLYRDLNGNSKLDPGEPKIGTATTLPDGSYLFTGLPTANNLLGAPGADYVVDVTDVNGVLAGYWQSLGTTGLNDNSQLDPYAVSIGTGIGDQPAPNNLTADFGYYIKPAGLGNYVWNDVNKDGIQNDGATGIDGVVVTLTIGWPGDATTKVTTVTGDNPATPEVEHGWYNFGNLLQDEDFNGDGVGPEPTFSVVVTPPSGYPYASPIHATVPADDSGNPTGEPATTVKGSVDITYDFGFYYSTTSAFLHSFKATVVGTDIRLRWETTSEQHNAGFNLYRATQADGPRTQVNEDLIPSAAPGSGEDSAYEYADAPLKGSQVYYYWLESVSISGETALYGPVEARTGK